MNNLPDKEADAVYALLGGYGYNYFNCYGWQNDPNKNPLIFDKKYITKIISLSTGTPTSTVQTNRRSKYFFYDSPQQLQK
jgi:hypothetical protein